MILRFSRKRRELTPERDLTIVWPPDTLDDIDDATFERAIAEGRLMEGRAESGRHLVDA